MKFMTLSAVLVCALAGTAQAVAPFSIAVYPDSQNSPSQVSNEVTFTINYQSTYNIVFATHEGDITGDGGAGNFSTVSTAMHRLDNLMPWGTVPGNHDFYGIANYDTYFGPSQFVGKSWYGGSYNHSSYVRFSAGDRSFIGLEIENDASADVLSWAQGILTANRFTPVILTTHDYLSDSTWSRTAYGDTLFNTLVKPNNQIFMVLCGHVHASGGTTDGEWRQTSTNTAGKTVYEMLADYQDRNNGMMRLITFDEDNSKIDVKTRIANAGTWETDDSSQFSYAMDFDTRLVPEPATMSLLALGGLALLRRRR